MNDVSVLERAAEFVLAGEKNPPPPAEVVAALLSAERKSRQTRSRYEFAQLIGDWRLCFVTGTKKTRQKAGIAIGAGRYIPQWVTIQLSYRRSQSEQNLSFECGEIANSVKIGPLQLNLTGPVKFLDPKNIVAFDFTQIKAGLGSQSLYQGEMRGGQKKEEEFYQKSIAKQPFFAYFLIQENLIAARGRGGGLALWARKV